MNKKIVISGLILSGLIFGVSVSAKINYDECMMGDWLVPTKIIKYKNFDVEYPINHVTMEQALEAASKCEKEEFARRQTDMDCCLRVKLQKFEDSELETTD